MYFLFNLNSLTIHKKHEDLFELCMKRRTQKEGFEIKRNVKDIKF